MSAKLRLPQSSHGRGNSVPFSPHQATNTASRRDVVALLEFLAGYYNPQVSPADIKIDTDKGAEVDDPAPR